MRQDLRYALRSLARHRTLSVVIIVTLALAIGANTAIFSVMDGLLLRALPVRDPQSLLLLRWSDTQAPRNMDNASNYGDCSRDDLGGPNTNTCSFSIHLWRTLQSQSHTLAALTAYAGWSGDTLVAHGQASTIGDQPVAGNYFEVLGLKPLLGRFFTPADDRPGAAPVIVLSYDFWQRRFGGERSVIGSSVELNQHSVTVIGVARPGFPGLAPGSDFDAWIPLSLESQIEPGGAQDAVTAYWLVLVGRAKPGVTPAAAQAELNGIFRNAAVHGAQPLAKPGDNVRLRVIPAQTGLSGDRAQFQQQLVVLLWLVGAILLIACANIAGLLVGRAQARNKEFAVRRALGAGGGRIVRQVLTESLLLAVLGGLAGLVLAYAAAHALVAMLVSSQNIPMALAAPLDARVLLFAVGVTVFTGLLSGLAPALRGAHAGLATSLKDGLGNSISASGRRRLRWLHLGNALVVAQVALCVVVLAGAGLLVRTLENLRSVDPGFDTHNLLLFTLDTEDLGYKGQREIALFEHVRRSLAALPGVEGVSYSQEVPLSGGYYMHSLRMSAKPGAKAQGVRFLSIGLDFFSTMHVHPLLGRGFRASDFVPPPPAGAKANPEAPPGAVIVNAAFVKKYLGPGDPIGREFGYDKHGAHPRYVVAGVVSNARYSNLRGSVPPVLYIPNNYGFANFEVRTAGKPMALLPAVRRDIHDIDPNLPLAWPTTESRTIDQLLFSERMLAKLASLFGALALLLAAIGLYALLAQEVTGRTQEIGIRMALGAERRQVLGLVLRLGAGLAVVGIGCGLAGAWAATRYLHSQLYGVGPTDPVTLGAASVILLTIALVACWLPARRATRVDPMVALRYE
ncbi:MAG: ABC transporter permease [Terriglobales bacterium]